MESYEITFLRFSAIHVVFRNCLELHMNGILQMTNERFERA